MKIFDLLVSPITSLGTTLYLRLLIPEYLQEFKKLYPDINLIPKQHFMVHYPRQIQWQVQVIIIANTYNYQFHFACISTQFI